MKFRRKPRENVEINLASLIDVVFILLLFFVVTTTFTRETQLKVDLPEAATGAAPENTERKQLEISIDVEGNFVLNGKRLLKSNLETLMAAMGKEAEGDTSLPVLISADGKTPHQAVVIAMDAAGKLGFSRLSIATVEAAEKAP